MDKKTKRLEKQLINKLIQGKTEYKSMSRLEKYQYTNETMGLVRDYCCRTKGIDPNRINFGFTKMNNSGVCYTNVLEDKSNVYDIYLQDTLPLVATPTRLVKTMFHEMEHVHQKEVRYRQLARLERKRPTMVRLGSQKQVSLNGQTPKQESTSGFIKNYNALVSPVRSGLSSIRERFYLAKTYTYYHSPKNIGWCSKNFEMGAENSSYTSIMKFALKGILKSPEHRVSFAKDYFKALKSEINMIGKHIMSKPIEPFLSLYNFFALSKSKVECLKQERELVPTYISQIEQAAMQNPEIFMQRNYPKVPPERTKTGIVLPKEDSQAILAMRRISKEQATSSSQGYASNSLPQNKEVEVANIQAEQNYNANNENGQMATINTNNETQENLQQEIISQPTTNTEPAVQAVSPTSQLPKAEPTPAPADSPALEH